MRSVLTCPRSGSTPNVLLPMRKRRSWRASSFRRSVTSTCLCLAFLPIRPAGIDAENLDLSRGGVHPKRAVPHAKEAILAGKFLQTVGDVHVAAAGAVLRAQDGVLAGVAGGILGC